MNKTILIVLIALLLLIGGYVLLQNGGEEDSSQEAPAPAVQSTPDTRGTQAQPPVSEGGVEEVSTADAPDAPVTSETKEFVVTGTNFEFSVKEMRVSKGDRVRIVFRNAGGVHDWTIDEFGAATQVIQAGQEEVIEFVADKTGVFEYYCSVGNHRQLGMRGKLIVE